MTKYTLEQLDEMCIFVSKSLQIPMDDLVEWKLKDLEKAHRLLREDTNAV